MKIYVYAICKNESPHIERWVNAMREADGIFVLDTGSTDDSVEKLTRLGCTVTSREITPWRFDTARNLSLSLVPDTADFLVCTDLDEIFDEGWRQKLEAAANMTGATKFNCRYVQSRTDNGADGIVLWKDRIHAPKKYAWKNPVREVLVPLFPDEEPKTAYAYGVQLMHLPDANKPREVFLPLLELAVREAPEDARLLHSLGGAYLLAGKWQTAIETLKRHLSHSGATDKEERAASMRYLSRCFANLENPAEATAWALRAVAESPDSREPYLDFALLCYGRADWASVLWACETALRITNRSFGAYNEPAAWGALPHDLLSIAYFHYGLFHKAVLEADAALAFGFDARIAGNRKLFSENL